MQRLVRALLLVGGLAMLPLIAIFYLQWLAAVLQWAEAPQWATFLVPWPITPVSYGFVAAMQAAIAAAMLWIAISGELGALAAGALNLVVMMSGLAGYFWLWASGSDGETGRLDSVIICALFALFNLLLLMWSCGVPIRDPRPMPTPVRISYPLFILVLVVVGGSLLLQGPSILPWKVDQPTGVLFGWMFLSDAFYFAYALLNPRWNHGRVQLWSFLAYSLVLLGPLGYRLYETLTTENPDFLAALPGLIVYLLVLVYSVGLGLYYLWLNPATRPNHVEMRNAWTTNQ